MSLESMCFFVIPNTNHVCLIQLDSLMDDGIFSIILS